MKRIIQLTKEFEDQMWFEELGMELDYLSETIEAIRKG